MISVVTAVLNGERYIDRCIQVVIEQNCPSVEHIIVDGLSRDKTVEIVKKRASEYSHIRWLSQKDRGQSDGLNTGIAMARGSIVGILNVDDYYELNVLNRVSTIFAALKSPSLVVGNCRVWNDDDKLLYINRPSKLKITDLLLGWDLNPHPVNPSAYFYHRSLHELIGPYSEQFGQDLPFLLSAVQIANVEYFDELWGNYREIEGTVTVKERQSGVGKQRYDRVMANYRKQLPVNKRIELAIKYCLRKGSRDVRSRLRTVLESCRMCADKRKLKS